jgi:hypothetical protein
VLRRRFVRVVNLRSLIVFFAGCPALDSAAEPPSPAEHFDDLQLPANQLNPAVPAPPSAFGHELGDGAVRHADVLRYARQLTETSDRVSVTTYAESHEGRTLFYLTLTSPRNRARLERIREVNARLADPRNLGAEEAEKLLDEVPGIAWMAYSIHGDELSGTDAAVALAYRLAAGTDPSTQRLLDELVIHIDCMMNPDGRERYLQQLEHLTGRVPNPDHQAMQHSGLWSAGRGNHYLFDLNRDWLMQLHPETRGRAAAILSWHPHLLVDSHEMGALDTYLFDPPREPINRELSKQNLKWRRAFAADQARAFDRHGWSYYTEEWYEEWYPGYTNAWANLLGTVGLLYEQAGVNGASVRQPSGQVLTYREAVRHQLVSSLANLETLRANRRDISRDFCNDRRDAAGSGDLRTFVVPPQADRSRVRRLVDLLQRQGLEVGKADREFTAQAVRQIWGSVEATRSVPAGTVLVRAAQPRRRLLLAMLDFDPRMTDEFLREERAELERRRGSRLYDTTTWNLAMAYGLEAYWAEVPADVPLSPPAANEPAAALEPGAHGYLIDGAADDVLAAVARLLADDCILRAARKPFTLDGQTYPRGSVLLRNHENPANLGQRLDAARAGLDVVVRPAHSALTSEGPDLGGNDFVLLEPPRVALASQWPVATTSFGALWHLLDARVGLRCSPLNIQGLGSTDLRRYNVIILPDAGEEALAAVLGEGVRTALRAWVESGGTLIAVGGSAAFAAGAKNGLSQVRSRREVLEQLKEYDEAVQQERAAREIRVDPEAVWGDKRPEPLDEDQASQAAVNLLKEKLRKDGTPKPDKEALERLDEWQRVFSPRGVFVAAELDVEHWLCFGLTARQPVFLEGSTALMSRHPVRTPVRLASADKLRLSGLLWPEARERWADTSYATVERVGRGQIVLFVADPAFRGYLEASQRMLLNAVLLGPGLGASQPVPW